MSSPQKKTLLRPLGSKAKTPGRSRRERNDRYIPNRGGTEIENAGLLEQLDTGGSELKCELAKHLSLGQDHRILSFKRSVRSRVQGSVITIGMCPKVAESNKPDGNGKGLGVLKSYRYIASQADRVLDAPDLADDFYMNVLDWGAENQLAVALGPCVYIWDGGTGSVDLFVEYNDPLRICSVKWTGSGTHLAIGLSNNEIELYDAATKKQLRVMRGQPGRVNAMSWNEAILTSGGKRGLLMNSDVRQKKHAVAMVEAHSGDICGLSWSDSKNQLASGGNDNLLAVWDPRQLEDAAHRFTEHAAAVKAIAWCPHQRKVLASGGGEADHHVRVWDTNAGSQLAAIDAKSQVSSLVWNPHDKEILGGLGQNQLRLWRWPSYNHITDLVGHRSRVLHMTLSPDGCTVCSGGADESLRFWKVFEKPAVPAQKQKGSLSVLNSVGIR